MKTCLLKKLRKEGLDAIHIYKIVKTNGEITGMVYSFDDDCYRGLYVLGDTESSVREKAKIIYINEYIKKNKYDRKDT